MQRLRIIIERDRTRVFEAHKAIEKTLGGVEWMKDSRGSYEYDDDKFQQEFGRAIDAIYNSIKPLTYIAENLNDSLDTQAEIEFVREVMKRGSKASLRADDGWLPAKEGEERGWLIEHGYSETSKPSYWNGQIAGWTDDHLKAVRFVRHRDAELVADLSLGGSFRYRICEHIWTPNSSEYHKRVALPSPPEGKS